MYNTSNQLVLHVDTYLCSKLFTYFPGGVGTLLYLLSVTFKIAGDESSLEINPVVCDYLLIKCSLFSAHKIQYSTRRRRPGKWSLEAAPCDSGPHRYCTCCCLLANIASRCFTINLATLATSARPGASQKLGCPMRPLPLRESRIVRPLPPLPLSLLLRDSGALATSAPLVACDSVPLQQSS